MDETTGNIQAVIQARVNSSEKVALEDVVPLRTPFSAHIDVSSVCNFKCSFCFQADTERIKAVNLKRGMMSVELFKRIVDDLKQFPDRFKKVKIGNHGEPTLHPNLPEMIAYLRDAGVTDTIELFTNGSKLEPVLNQKLIGAGINRINISLEGLDSETYERVAGVKQDMNAMVEGIRHLYSIRCECRIYVKIANYIGMLDRNDSTILVLSEEDRTRFFSRFGNICDEIYVENVVPQWARTQYDKQNEVGITGMYGQKIRNYKQICPFIFMYLHFNWDGSTSPCTLDWAKRVLIGNVKEVSVTEIWNGERLRLLQVAQMDFQRHRIDFCNDCNAPMVCCNEDLDGHVAAIRSRMGQRSETGNINNPWLET
ncbi:MAG: radical SAM protein [Magnetococcales bacterium]|nr:radical SAM protein [Magnetococcales bacterium]